MKLLLTFISQSSKVLDVKFPLAFILRSMWGFTAGFGLKFLNCLKNQTW